ncbi:MAG TPA: hypothetical protein PLU30_04985 [Verrucomicrobiae bacterium]|nr:hypothetical protein [Verrucomicrobiae bacterium]
MKKAAWLVWMAVASVSGWAFDGHKATEGPLTVEIAPVEGPTPIGQPIGVGVELRNAGVEALRADVELLGLADDWRIAGPRALRAEVPAGGTGRLDFRIVAGERTCAALYPVRARVRFCGGDSVRVVDVVRVFEAEPVRGEIAAAGGADLGVIEAIRHGALRLEKQHQFRVGWNYFGQPARYEAVGWQGQVAESKASFGKSETVRGDRRLALSMHPPYHGGKGVVFAEYRVHLPKESPIALVFGNAIRDTGPKEPPSDGVTFRVWADEGSGRKKLFDRHTDSKVWVDGQADLTAYAGKVVTIALECDPGPKQNTTCDSAFWGEPAVVAGPGPEIADEGRLDLARSIALASLGARRDGKGVWFFDLGGGHEASVALGPNGLADGALAFSVGGRAVVYRGMRLDVLGERLGAWPSGAMVRSVDASRDLFGRLRIRHRLLVNGEEAVLAASAWRDGPCLRLRVECPSRLTTVTPGPAVDQGTRRVYFGHGYCVDRPEAFRVSGGGHGLATSHVGFEFENGVSLLVACDNPPHAIAFDPAAKTCALETHMDVTYAFVPGGAGPMDCAIRYRPHFDKRAASAVSRKAGRFVFDIWGGKYPEIGDYAERVFAYGATDSMLLIHNWQRWGYDYRLPDIYPPNPKYGNLEDMRRVGQICRAADVPWGLHDNYIDFYPDAEGYDYGNICFNETGRPVKAWINDGRDAQSYRWRPDRFEPFLRRNLDLMRQGVAPTASFVDVFTSAGCFDFYDREGYFHSFLETRAHWGGAFATIRNAFFGGPTCSEAGHDQLIGWIDGADCQHLELSLVPAQHTIRVGCGDWERVPWADAVYHTKFILHGAGYSVRYQNVRSRRDHGIESDDYLGTEMLTGHALMTDWGAGVRGAVRKYWLAQDFIRSMAGDEIAGMDFERGNIHRLTVRWQSGATVRVNRSAHDWAVDGRVLPRYGFFARNGGIEATVERVGNVIVERSRAPGHWYVNGRANDPSPPLPVRPSADRLEDLGGGRFRLSVDWELTGEVGRDLNVFVHVRKPVVNRLARNEVTVSYRPAAGTSKWQGKVTTGADRDMVIPPEFPDGEYDILVGLFDPKGGRRYSLQGEERDDRRYRIGALIVEKQGGSIGKLRLEPTAFVPEEYRFNVGGGAVDFGEAVTSGAIRCEVTGRGKGRELALIPLPDEPSCRVGIRPARLGFGAVTTIEAVDSSGKAMREVPLSIESGVVYFETRAGDFGYRLR